MMKAVQWLVRLAQRNPILFGVALLLIGCYIAGSVIKFQQDRIGHLENQITSERVKSENRLDSLTLVYSQKEERLNAETKATLNSMLDDYRQQLKEQQNLNRRISNSLTTNDVILKENERKLKQLNHDY